MHSTTEEEGTEEEEEEEAAADDDEGAWRTICISEKEAAREFAGAVSCREEQAINQVAANGPKQRQRASKLTCTPVHSFGTWRIVQCERQALREEPERRLSKVVVRQDYDDGDGCICIDCLSAASFSRRRRRQASTTTNNGNSSNNNNNNSRALQRRPRKTRFISSAASPILLAPVTTTTTTTAGSAHHSPAAATTCPQEELPADHACYLGRTLECHYSARCYQCCCCCCYYCSSFRAASDAASSRCSIRPFCAAAERPVGVATTRSSRGEWEWPARLSIKRTLDSSSSWPFAGANNWTWKRRRRRKRRRLFGQLRALPVELPEGLAAGNKALNNGGHDNRSATADEDDDDQLKKSEELKLNSSPSSSHRCSSAKALRPPRSPSLPRAQSRPLPLTWATLLMLALMLMLNCLTAVRARTQTANSFVLLPTAQGSVDLLEASGQLPWQLIAPEINWNLSAQTLFSDPQEVGASVSSRTRRQRAEHRNLRAASGRQAVSSESRRNLVRPSGHFARHSGHESSSGPPMGGFRPTQTSRRQQQQLAWTDESNLLLMRPQSPAGYQSSGQLLMLSHHQPALLAGIASSSFPQLSACAQVQECTCTWKNGKQSADCSAGQLLGVPANLDPLTQVLNLSSNPLGQLSANAFQAANLTNLQRIYLSSCQLSTVHLKAFERLKLVVELELNWNKLNKVPLIQISQLKLLRKLSMRGNPLGSLDESTFTSSSLPAENGAEAASSPPTSSSSLDEKQPLAVEAVEASELPSARWWDASTQASLSRLLETYPELSGTLIAFARQLEDPDAGSGSAGRGPKSLSRVGEPAEWRGGQMMIELMELLRSLQLESELEAQEGGGGAGNFNSLTAASSSSSSDYSVPPQEQQQQQQLEDSGLLGGYFNHLQELDFGHCQLSYISWKAFQGLSQLKRVHLDNNKLRQLSGRLIRALPLGLHQLALEENLFICDCRLLALKRWLLSTRTPLSLPVKCHQDASKQLKQHHPSAHQQQQLHRKTPSRRGAGTNSMPSTSTSSSSSQDASLSATSWASQENQKATSNELLRLLDSTLSTQTAAWLPALSQQEGLLSATESSTTTMTMTTTRKLSRRREADVEENGSSSSSSNGNLADLPLDHFVCAPQVAAASEDGRDETGKLVSLDPPSSLTLTASQRLDRSGKLRNESLDYQQALQPQQLIHYLSETLVVRADATTTTTNLTSSSQNSSHHNTRHQILAFEADKVTLRCPLIVYPEWSVHFIWLADYNSHRGGHTQSVGMGATSGERTVVLYDSRNPTPPKQSEKAGTSSRRSLESPELSLEQSDLTADYNKLDDEDHLEEGQDYSARPTDGTRGPSNFKESRALHGERLSVREFSQRPKQRKRRVELTLRESQLIIRSALLNDSARYRCVAGNAAGNVSLEFMLRVSPHPENSSGAATASGTVTKADPLPPTAGGAQRDLRHHLTSSDPSSWSSSPSSDGYKQKIGSQRFQQRGNPQTSSALEVTTLTITETAAIPGRASPSAWLKSWTTFQVTIVLVSLLMGAVTVAFLLFCVLIYQIKPSQTTSLTGSSANLPVASTNLLAHQQLLLGAPPFEGNLINPQEKFNQQQVDGSFGFLAAQRTITDNSSTGSGTGSSRTVGLTAAVNCNPISGQSPVHLIAQPHSPATYLNSSAEAQQALVNQLVPVYPPQFQPQYNVSSPKTNMISISDNSTTNRLNHSIDRQQESASYWNNYKNNNNNSAVQL